MGLFLCSSLPRPLPSFISRFALQALFADGLFRFFLRSAPLPNLSAQCPARNRNLTGKKKEPSHTYGTVLIFSGFQNLFGSLDGNLAEFLHQFRQFQRSFACTGSGGLVVFRNLSLCICFEKRTLGFDLFNHFFHNRKYWVVIEGKYKKDFED